MSGLKWRLTGRGSLSWPQCVSVCVSVCVCERRKGIKINLKKMPDQFVVFNGSSYTFYCLFRNVLKHTAPLSAQRHTQHTLNTHSTHTNRDTSPHRCKESLWELFWVRGQGWRVRVSMGEGREHVGRGGVPTREEFQMQRNLSLSGRCTADVLVCVRVFVCVCTSGFVWENWDSNSVLKTLTHQKEVKGHENSQFKRHTHSNTHSLSHTHTHPHTHTLIHTLTGTNAHTKKHKQQPWIIQALGTSWSGE